jgi:prophage antirepressor-like protein
VLPPRRLPYRGNPTRLIVSQAGLFRLLIRGHSEASTGFRDWLCATVLPALLRDQRYILPKSAKMIKASPRRSFAQWDDAIGDPKTFLGLIQSDTAPTPGLTSDAAVGA